MATTRSPDPQQPTQGTIPNVITLLITHLVDKDNAVSASVHKSLCTIAAKHPNDVLRLCCQFCSKNKDIKSASRMHVGVVLGVMEIVTRERVNELDGGTVLDLMGVCVELMTQSVQGEERVQAGCVGVMTGLGRSGEHCVQVVDCLTEKITPGIAPHFAIAQCFGSLAVANVNSMVPLLKPIMGLLMPLLSGLKHDHVKKAFTYCFCSFSEAILEYTSNLDHVTDNTINKDFFATEMSMTFDVLFAQLLQARDHKLVEETLYAISSIFIVQSADKIRLNALKTLQALLNLFKRHKESYVVTKCLSSVLTVTTGVDGTLLEQHVPALLQALSDLIFIAPDYAQPERLRTHTEALRCYQTVCAFYTDHSVDHLLGLVKNAGEKDKVRGLVVLTHLANASGDSLRNRLSDIMAVVGEQLNIIRSENSVWVHRALMKTVVAFAYKEFLSPTGIETEKYIEYLVYLCIKTNQINVTTSDSMEMSDLKQSAGNNLYMLTTSSKYLEGILTRLFTQCLLKLDYLDASVVLLKCLTHLASRNPIQNSTDAEDLFIRCFALLSQPISNFRGNFILNFLKHVVLFEDDKNWESRLLKLIKYLEQNYEMFNACEWEQLLFEFLHNVLQSADSQSGFAARLLEAVSSQMPNYNCVSPISDQSLEDKQTSEKRYLLIALGIIGSYLIDDKTVSRILDLILSNAKPHNIIELHATAKSIAICCRVHFKLVMSKLESVRKDALVKKSSKLFSFSFIRGGEKGDVEMERIRYVIIASYKEICDEADSCEVLRVVEGEMLNFVLGELTTCKDFIIRKISLESIAAIAQLLHPSRNTLHIHLHSKDTVVQTVAAQLQLHSGPEYIELFPVVLRALTALVRLPQQALEPAQRQYLVKLGLDTVFNASAIYCRMKVEHDSDTASIKSTDSYGNLKLSPFIHNSFPLLNTFLCSILSQSLTPDGLDEISTLLEPWLSKKKVEQRLPAMEALRSVLDHYLEGVQFAFDAPTSFGQAGWLLARVIPRVMDPYLGVRRAAVACVRAVLAICSRYEGRMKDHDLILTAITSPLLTLITTPHSLLLPTISTLLTQILTQHLPAHQLTPFILSLVGYNSAQQPTATVSTVSSTSVQQQQSNNNGSNNVERYLNGACAFLDVEADSSAGAAGVFAGVVGERGGEMQLNVVADVVACVLGIIGKVKCVRTKVGVMEGVAKLGQHHMKTVVGVLLSQPLPYESSCRQLWTTLITSHPTSLTPAVLHHLKHIVTSTAALISPPTNSHQQTLVDLRSFQAMSALEQLMQSAVAVNHIHSNETTTSSLVEDSFSDWVVMLLGVRAAYVGATAVGSGSNKAAWGRDAYKISPGRVAGNALKGVLGGCDVVDCVDNPTAFTAMLPSFTFHICHFYPHHLPPIILNLIPNLHSPIELQRMTAATCLTELLVNPKLLSQLGTKPPIPIRIVNNTSSEVGYPVQQDLVLSSSQLQSSSLSNIMEDVALINREPQLITQDQLILADSIVEVLLDVASGVTRNVSNTNVNREEDAGANVRCLCMKAIGAASAEFFMGKLVERHCAKMVGALMRGLDYGSSSEWDVALHSMLALSFLIHSFTPSPAPSPTPNTLSQSSASPNQSPFAPILRQQCHITAAVRIKPLFQHDDAKIRRAAVQLLGDLAVSVDGGQAEGFREQVLGNIMVMLLHLQDVDEEVVKACKLTLRNVGPLLDCPKINTMIQNHVFENGSLNFTKFITDLVQCMQEEISALLPQLIATCVFCLRSQWWEIRAGAALTAGLLYNKQIDSSEQQSSLDTVCYRLTQLLKDERADVRASAAKALALVVNA